MAAISEIPMVNITVNDVAIQVPKGELIVEAVKRLGLEIPIFCYHPRMKPVGMCRMCLVEVGTKGPDGSVRMMPKPQAACSLPASEGLVILTDTERLHTDRRGVLEFLLINHPLDCPICDRGGECPLQNNTLFYGPSTSRFVEMKRHAPKAFPLSKYVTLDLERCIQCGRCVRFTEEISGDAQLGFRFRGASMQPSTFQMTDFESKFSGNVIEICPVGALTSTKYRFRARPWDLQTKPGICTLCSNGCNIHVDYRKSEIVRINGRTNEEVNEEWTCDKGKFGHYAFNTDKRIERPLLRRGDQLAPVEWSSATAAVLEVFRNAGSKAAVIAGPDLSNEDYASLVWLFKDQLGTPNVDHRFEKYLPEASSSIEAKLGVSAVQNRIADFATVGKVFVFGTSLADEEPILYLRVRKGATNNGTKVGVAYSELTEVTQFAADSAIYHPGSEAILATALLNAVSGGGGGEFAATGLSEAELDGLAKAISGAAIVTTRGLYDLPEGAQIVEALAKIAQATGGTFNCYARKSNEEGATLAGVVPGPDGRNTHQILAAAAAGEISALWLSGVDLFSVGLDAQVVEKALENVEFLVVQDWIESETTAYASVVLPMTATLEADGSYTNLERRVQFMKAVIPLRGDAKSAWRAFSDVSMRLKARTPFFNAGEILNEIGTKIPAFAGASEESAHGEGFTLALG